MHSQQNFYLVFDPEIQENSKYREVFEEFKNLVDFMLGNFMDDMGITSQQFEMACAKATQDGISLHFDQVGLKKVIPHSKFHVEIHYSKRGVNFTKKRNFSSTLHKNCHCEFALLNMIAFLKFVAPKTFDFMHPLSNFQLVKARKYIFNCSTEHFQTNMGSQRL